MKKDNITAIKLAWGFFKGNYALNFAALSLLALLNLLGIIPLFGMLFVLGYSLLSFSIQIYFARRVDEIATLTQIEEKAKDTKIGPFLIQYLSIAAGGFLGLFLIGILFFFILGLIIAQYGGYEMMSESMMQNEVVMRSHMVQFMMSASLPMALLLVIFGALFYFFPAVVGRVMRQDDFNSAFKTVFLLFSPTLWKSTLSKDYFLLVFGWSFILFLAAFILFLLMASLILLPLVFVLAYLISLYNAAIYSFGADLAQGS